MLGQILLSDLHMFVGHIKTLCVDSVVFDVAERDINCGKCDWQYQIAQQILDDQYSGDLHT